MKRQKQKPNREKIILGLTGSFGSGKTTVAGFFRRLGADVLDADKLAHESIAPESPVYKKIVNSFGKTILNRNGIIDRKELARIVFNNKNLLLRLNNIIHPKVINRIKAGIRSSRAKVVVLDAPLLVEAGLTKMVDKLIVVKVTKIQQIRRIRNKTSLTKADILKRIKCQFPLRKKVRIADFVIDNSGSIENTKRQAIKIWRCLQPQD